MSEWLDLMLDEIARKRLEHTEAAQELCKRDAPQNTPKDDPKPGTD